MAEYYAVKVRKDIAKALPFVIILLVIAFYAGKAIWGWNPQEESILNITEKEVKEPKEEQQPAEKQGQTEPTMGCAAFKQELDKTAQGGLEQGYLCDKKEIECEIPPELSYEERIELSNKKMNEKYNGFYFDAQKYVYKYASNRLYYVNQLTGVYECEPSVLGLLKKFVYEQQWKEGNTYSK